MLKIEHDEDFFYAATCDFVSLECCLAAQDQGLNPSGVDQVMYDIYGPDGHQDMHSQTAFGTFGKPVDLEVLEMTDEDTGKVWVFHDNSWAVIERGGKRMEVIATDIEAYDTIIEKIDKIGRKRTGR
jgi:hypothetical protein